MIRSATNDAPSALTFAQSTTGDVLLSAAQFYEITTEDAWGYMHDMARIAAGEMPAFGPPDGYGIDADVASTLHANALACSMAQMLAMDGEGLHNYFGSMLDFAEQHKSLDGLESVFFSGGVSVLHELDSSFIEAGSFLEGVSDHMHAAGDLLERAGAVWDVVGGLKNVVTHGGDLVPVIDSITGQFGFPSLHTIEEFITNPFESIEGFVGEAVDGFLSPGHQLFDRVQHTVGVISSEAAHDFEAFRESEVGQFVETVASVAVGIGLMVEAPIVRTIKVGVAVVESVVTFVGGVFESIFGSSDENQPERPRETHHGDEVHRGQHALVGCWVEDPEVVPEALRYGNTGRPLGDGTCPEPDLLLDIPQSVPMPGDEGSWPTRPSPWLGGEGLGALVHFDEQMSLQMAFDDSGFLDMDGIAPSLGWDEVAFQDLIAEIELLAGTVAPDRAKVVSTTVNDTARFDVLITPGQDHVFLQLRTGPVKNQAKRIELEPLLVITGQNRFQVVDPDTELALSRKAVEARAALAHDKHELDPISAVADLIPRLRDEVYAFRHAFGM